MDAVAEFNLIKGGFDTPLRVERYNFDGKLTDVFTMDGRYDVPCRKQDAYSLDLIDRMGIWIKELIFRTIVVNVVTVNRLH